MKKKLILVLILLVLLVGVFIYIAPKFSRLWRENSASQNVDLPAAKNYQEFVTSTKEEIKNEVKPDEEQPEEDVVIKAVFDSEIAQTRGEIKNINLNVPFTSQAPSANWEQPYQDACEEASFLMLDYYYQNKKFGSATDTEKLINTLVDWQVANWGAHANLPVQELKKLVGENSTYRVELVYDLTAEKIKNILQTGQPLIVPANGKKLANPNFKNGGPEYHMLVIKGYVDDKFITNDPGTRLGADFIYTSENLLDSIADWDTLSKKADGPKTGIIIRK